MAREKKAKNYKGKPVRGRHGYAWNPEYGWQILRRTPGYIAAVETFLSEAKAAKDVVSLSIFNQIMTSRRAIAFGRRKGAKNSAGFGDLSVYDRVLIAKARASFAALFEKTTSGRSAREKVTALQTKHFQRFHKKYGDIIAFPLHYGQSRPSPMTLAALWNLFPVISVLPTDKNIGNRTITLEIKLNANFSDAAILQETDRIVKYALMGERHDLTPNRFLMGAKRWEHFNQQINAYDLSMEDGLGYQRIGDAILGDSEQSGATRKKWAENSIKLVKSKLIPFFDR
jgi:hypothetical protein